MKWFYWIGGAVCWSPSSLSFYLYPGLRRISKEGCWAGWLGRLVKSDSHRSHL